jgi:hypothetical protein
VTEGLLDTKSDHHYSPVGMTLNSDLTLDRWLEIGHTLDRITRSLGWLVGDWLNYGEGKYGEDYAQGMQMSGLAYKTVANYKWVASRVPREIRHEGLSFGHHDAVSRMSATDQEIWLDKAEANGWTREDLRKAIAADGTPTPTPTQPGWSLTDADRAAVGQVTILNADDEQNAVEVAEVKDVLEEAVALTELPLTELDPEMLSNAHERFQEVLHRVSAAPAFTVPPANGNGASNTDEDFSKLREVAFRACDVVEGHGEIEELRVALVRAGYLEPAAATA